MGLNNNAKVSVVIPVYNAEKYLHKCLGTVCRQTLRDIEIICINDGSYDSSLDILKRYGDRDPRIKIITQFNETKPEKIILDFTNVSYITSGLAKELFGGLYDEFGLSMRSIISIRVGKDNSPLKTTIIRALATVIS